MVRPKWGASHRALSSLNTPLELSDREIARHTMFCEFVVCSLKIVHTCDDGLNLGYNSAKKTSCV